MIHRLETSRRDFIRLGGGALSLGAVTAFPTRPQSQIAHSVKGRICDEASGAGLQGVMVSNGRDVAVTDASGCYALRAERGSTIFMVKPAGWSPPVDAHTMLPRIHHQVGAAKSYDFTLRRTVEPKAFDVLMFADPQPADAAEISYIREQVVGALRGSSAAFGLTLGDVTGDNPSLYQQYNEVIGEIGVPWWNLPGNHDLDTEVNPALARETWKRTFGPPAYAFEHASALFIMLDNVEWRGHPHPYRGRIGEAQLHFVRALLSTTPEDRLIVLCMHIPLISAADPEDPGCNTMDRDALLEMFGCRPSVSFSGHMHTTEHHYLPLPHGGTHHHHVLTAVSGSWWSGPLDPRGVPLAQSCDGTPNGWHVLTIDGASYTTRFVSAREPAQMRIMLEETVGAQEAEGRLLFGEPVAQDHAHRTQIVVNVFDAGPRTHVECSVSAYGATLMSRQVRKDPETCDLFVRAGATRKPWVEALPSSHVWVAPLPQGLCAGVHRISVTAVNEYGEAHTSSVIFEMA